MKRQPPTERNGLTTTTEIARALGVNFSVARATEQRAMRKFARELERRGIKPQDLLPG